MGVSTDGVIFYGYCWDEEEDFEADSDKAVEEIMAQRGIQDPWRNYVEPDRKLPYAEQKRIENEWTTAHRAEIDAYFAAKKVIEDELPVEWGEHGADRWRVPYLFIKGTETRAWRGDPKPITDLSFNAHSDWRGQLDDFLKHQNIDPPEGGNQPGWWLVSWWG